MIRGCSASRSKVSGSIATTLRGGMSYSITGRPVASATAVKCAQQPLLRRPGVVRRDDEQAVRARLLGRLGQVDAVRGVVGARPGTTVARSPTAATTARTSSAFSSSVVVGLSPVVPLTTSPSLPSSTRCAASSSARFRSSAPSASNGVTMAVSTRPNGRPGSDLM